MATSAHSGVLDLARRAYGFMRRLMDRLARNNYHMAKVCCHYQWAIADRRYNGPPPLWVYQMGKVGSASVVASLQAMDPDRPVYHIHSLLSEPLREWEMWLRESFPHSLSALRHVWRCQRVRKQVSRGLDGEKQKVITLVRDPIARNLSNFFQHIQVEPSGPDRRWKLTSTFHGFETVVNGDDTKELIQIFFEKQWHDLPLIWFDRELKDVLGIDVYASGFPLSRGYAIYEGKQADVLLVRLENLNDCAAEAFNEFLDINKFALVDANVSDRKAYADIYRAVKASIVAPKAYLDRMYTSKFAQHFYSEAEIAEFRAKWSETRA